MLKELLLLCLLLASSNLMGRKWRLCPCLECEDCPVVDPRTWTKHAGEIARGVRRRLGVLDIQPVVEEAKDVEVVDNIDVEVEDNKDEEEDQTATNYAREIAELVSTGAVGVTAASKILKVTARSYEALLPEEVTIPGSWHQAKKLACKGKEPVYFTRDYCPLCDHPFQVDKHDTHCPRCELDTRYDLRGKAPRQAYYYCMDDKCRRLLLDAYSSARANPPLHAEPPRDTLATRELSGPFDGSILQNLHYERKDQDCDKCWYFAVSNDGVEVEKNVSYTPITAKLLNLPAELRGLLTCIWLLGYVYFCVLCACVLCVCVSVCLCVPLICVCVQVFTSQGPRLSSHVEACGRHVHCTSTWGGEALERVLCRHQKNGERLVLSGMDDE